jgi:uncharacterized LabA/DUF88 family protein
MRKAAILVDASFFLRQFSRLEGGGDSDDPVVVARGLHDYCWRHLFHKVRNADRKQHSQLYRIFVYDCPPITKRVHHPFTDKAIDFAKTPTAVFRTAFHKALTQLPNVALRRGYLDERHAKWQFRTPEIEAAVIRGRTQVSELGDGDVLYYARQKGVDMRIGLDIASLAYKKLAEVIVLVAGDSDFVPAAKLARREGLEFVLDPMRRPIKPDLSEHIDRLHTPLRLKRIGATE